MRAAIATTAPGSANARAIARPMPRPPPVTRIVAISVRRHSWLSVRQCHRSGLSRHHVALSPWPRTARTRRETSATRTTASDRRTGRRRDDRSRAGRRAPGKSCSGSSMRSPLRLSARTVMARARGTRPRMSGMLRQPSQSSTISGPGRDDLGIHDHQRLGRSSSPSSSASSSATKIRRLLVDLRRRQPDAAILVIVSIMSSISFCTAGAAQRRRDRARGPGCAAPDAPCARPSEWT